MELRHLRYFVALAEELNFTRAAQKLCTVQPSLSQQIKDLEEEVGVQLIDRSARKIALTAEGQGFLKYALESIKYAELAVAHARQIANQGQQQLFIGVLHVAEMTIIPHVIQQVRAQFPQVDLKIRSLSCSEQVQALKNSELDLIFSRVCMDDPVYTSTMLFEEKLLCVAHQNYIANREIQDLRQIQNDDFIVCDQLFSPFFYQRIEEFTQKENLKLQYKYQVTNALQHINLINMGLGWSFIPEYARQLLNSNVQSVELKQDLPTLPLYASYRTDAENPVLQFTAKIIQQSVQQQVSK